ncbi:hypothetical protein HMPREF0682_1846 [Propionibacterium acidifaciens F0233]|uniref:Transposase n=1 Tax=Propionibacterium acidifaciens F0233 TaxID=553198 RepID=U2S5B8_9ACTN|nr:hypothetical protein HMPREF0682_1846 [Propionibacterium acidifaciens F0233]
MPGSAPKGCPVEPGERAIRMVAEIRAGHESEWAAMSRVAGPLGAGTPEAVRKGRRRAGVDAGSRRSSGPGHGQTSRRRHGPSWATSHHHRGSRAP